ncbi:MAG: ISL3 family transposase [Lachnospiraceae bacterium]|nr:ISL3 family transposase [Lachnospiraceae bacterium]
MAADNNHTIKEELKDLYEYVRPIPSLNIPELKENECIKPKDNDYEYIFHVSPVSKRNQACDECGSLYYHVDGKSKDRKVSDISQGLIRVSLQVEVPRYKCQDCGHKFSHKFECLVPGTKFTTRLYEQIRLRSFAEPFSKLAEEYAVTIPTISDIMVTAGREMDEAHPLIAPKVLGIDEKHIEHKMRAIYVDIESGVLLEMTKDNKRETVENLIKSMKGYENIKVVTTDMAQGYRPIIEELLPNAVQVVDKYHVIQLLQQATKRTRTLLTEEAHATVNAMPECHQKAYFKSLLTRAGKDSYLFKFNEDRVSENPERLSLTAELCYAFPEFDTLRLLKDGFANIYKCDGYLEAIAEYEEWKKLLRSADKTLFAEFKKFGRTVTAWKTEIFRYFEPGCRYTNAAAEGLNSLIQAINTQGRGYGFEVLRLKALYSKSAALPKRTVTEYKYVYDHGFAPSGGMGMTIHFPSKRIEETTIVYPRGAYIDKLLELTERDLLYS